MKIIWAIFLSISLTLAMTIEEKGLKIAKEMRDANIGFIGEEADMKMLLIDAYGAEIPREMKGKVKEVPNDGDKSLSVFITPKDVKGTKMLTWSHKNKDDDQWLYLASFKRIKRISSRSKSSSFMGSEFSFEDLGSQEVEKYNFKYLRDEKVGSEDTVVIERTPKSKSGYSKQVVWNSTKYNNPIKIQYFDRKGELLKEGVFSDFKE